MESWTPVSQVISGVEDRSRYTPLKPVDQSLLFRTLPPERVGPSGEYDYYGLIKRVMLRYKSVLGPETVTHLRLRQRGSVVVLSGQIRGRVTVSQLINLALQVDGTTYVEVRELSINDISYSSQLTSQSALAPI